MQPESISPVKAAGKAISPIKSTGKEKSVRKAPIRRKVVQKAVEKAVEQEQAGNSNRQWNSNM